MTATREPSLANKVAFLSRPDAYPHRADEVVVRETHMSWVFLAGDTACKLKKPVRFPYLDFRPWRGARRPAGPSCGSTGGLRPTCMSGHAR